MDARQRPRRRSSRRQASDFSAVCEFADVMRGTKGERGVRTCLRTPLTTCALEPGQSRPERDGLMSKETHQSPVHKGQYPGFARAVRGIGWNDLSADRLDISRFASRQELRGT